MKVGITQSNSGMDESRNQSGESVSVGLVLKSEIKSEPWRSEPSDAKELLVSTADMHTCYPTTKEETFDPTGWSLQLRVKQEKSDDWADTQQIGNEGVDLMTYRPFPVALYKVDTALRCMAQLDTIPSSAGDPERQLDLSLQSSHVEHTGLVDSSSPASKCNEHSPSVATPEDATPEDATRVEKQFRCELCPYSCVCKGGLTRHMRTHVGEKPYKCSTCPCGCADQSQLKNQERTHTGEWPYRCSYGCTVKSPLTSPMRTHTGPYTCAHKNNLKRHERLRQTGEKSGEKPYICTSCAYSCAVKSVLEAHMMTHSIEKPFKCTLCPYGSARKSALNEHIRTHTGEKPYTCTICPHTCGSKTNLKTHMRIHTGEKPYKCTVCPYSCTQKVHLEIHTRTHTGERPYKCTVCPYSCIRIVDMKRHEMIHTGEKPYNCTICPYRAARKGRLVKHMKVHTDEKPHIC